MTTKYHISRSNRPALCEAEQRACPRGHYPTFEEAHYAILSTTTPEYTPEAETLKIGCMNAGVFDPRTVVDHEGQTLLQRWEALTKAASFPATTTEEEFIYRSLGGLDTGRERGAYVVWVPAGEHADPNGEYEYVSEENWDEKYAEGANPVINIHTRNGGGNRECQCDGNEHDSGCLSVIIDRMEEHPRHISNADNDYDATYADFMYSVPMDEHNDLREVVFNARMNSIGSSARSRLRAIATAENKALFTSLFPENPERREKYRQARAKTSQIQAKMGELANKNATLMNQNLSGGYIRGWAPTINEQVRDILERYRSSEAQDNSQPQFRSLKAVCKTSLTYLGKLESEKQKEAEFERQAAEMRELSPELARDVLARVPKKRTESYAKRQANEKHEKNIRFLSDLYRGVEKWDALSESHRIANMKRDEALDNLHTPSSVVAR